MRQVEIDNCQHKATPAGQCKHGRSLNTYCPACSFHERFDGKPSMVKPVGYDWTKRADDWYDMGRR
jgi:hypothetical protein